MILIIPSLFKSPRIGSKLISFIKPWYLMSDEDSYCFITEKASPIIDIRKKVNINNVIKFLNFIFHSSVLFLIIISLYPGSLLGYLLYGDFGTQPNLISNPYGTSINHFIFYFYVSGLGLCLYSKKTNFPKCSP